MHVEVGDELVVRGRRVAAGERVGMVVEVHGDHGGPPYLIRWQDGHQCVFFPAFDALVERHPAAGRPAGG